MLCIVDVYLVVVFSSWLIYKTNTYWLLQAKERILDALENGNFSGLVDSRLKGEYNKEEVYKMAKVILGCIKLKPEDRPTMAQVINPC